MSRDVQQVLASKVQGYAHLHVFHAVLLADTPQHVLLAAFLHLAREKKLVQNEVRLLEVEDDVEFAHVAVILVHLLHVAMDNLKSDELVVRGGAAGDEEEGSVAAVNNLAV